VAGGRRVPTIDIVIPARNEARTVADVVLACGGCAHTRNVIVVDDGSTDDTAARAAAAGARVVRREPGGSKAHAMAAGVAATDAEAVLFVDADLLGLRSHHLDDICRPFVEGRAVMSIGTFDYGGWNPLVLRFPPTTGERVVPRWVFETVPPAKLDGYTIEVMINEVVAEGRLPTTARVMHGVTHRTKRQKFGPIEGWRRTWRMFWQLVCLMRVVRFRTYFFYLRDLTIES
jgi:glycosyltransferase involved in cell wall biosynthesis